MLAHQTHVDLAAVVANRVLPALFGRGEEAMFDLLREPDAEAVLVECGRSRRALVLALPSCGARCGASVPRTSNAARDLVPPASLLYVPELFARSKGCV